MTNSSIFCVCKYVCASTPAQFELKEGYTGKKLLNKQKGVQPLSTLYNKRHYINNSEIVFKIILMHRILMLVVCHRLMASLWSEEPV